MSTIFRLLFSPLRIGSVIVPNRIFFPAHLTNFAEDNMPTERHAYYYAERAKGGAGLIITEEQSVHPSDWAYQKLIHAFEPAVISRYCLITDMVHRYGAKIFAQLNHNGGQGTSLYSESPLWAPSPVPDQMFHEMPKEMEREDIHQVLEGYAKTAHYVKKGGFDGIELQASHSSLIRQFFSPYSNQRTDKYGGNRENRLRFSLEVIDAVRQEIGRELVIGIRLCGDELIDGGLTLEDTLEIARRLEATGKLDYINTSIGTASQTLFMVDGSMHLPPGYALFIPSALRRTVALPVFGVGRIKDPVQAEQVLAEGHADMVGMVRALIADPELVHKAREGRREDIRLCLSCNQGCIGRVGLNVPLNCLQNPAASREKELGSMKQAIRRKRVMVIGGGPAGLEAARVAALRGHQVVLYEKESQLGGQVNLAIKAPGRAEFGEIIRNLSHDIERLGVKIKLGQEASPDTVVGESPDAVVVATGSLPGAYYIPGADRNNVFEVRQVLTGEARTGKRIVLIDQVGFHQATGTAEFLANQGKEVQILTPAFYAGQDLATTLDLETWHRRAGAKGITITPNVSVLEIGENSLRLLNHYPGNEWRLEGIDSVVLAIPGRANDSLYFSLKGKVRELYRVGDCVAPRRVYSAVWEGHQVGRTI